MRFTAERDENGAHLSLLHAYPHMLDFVTARRDSGGHVTVHSSAVVVCHGSTKMMGRLRSVLSWADVTSPLSLEQTPPIIPSVCDTARVCLQRLKKRQRSLQITAYLSAGWSSLELGVVYIEALVTGSEWVDNVIVLGMYFLRLNE